MNELEFSLLRYMPDAGKGEFVNIAVLVTGQDHFAQMRFTRDWSRVLCLDANADLEMLEAIEAELQRELRDLSEDGRKRLMKLLTETFSNSLELSPAKAVLTEDTAAEVEKLAQLFLEPLAVRAPRERLPGARRRLANQVRSALEEAGVLGLMREGLQVAKYTRQGDPLRIDFAYGINGGRPRALKLMHALALESDPDSAKVLAFTWPALAKGISQQENAAASLVAIVSHEQFDDERARFALDVLAASDIAVRPIAQLSQIVEQVRHDLL